VSDSAQLGRARVHLLADDETLTKGSAEPARRSGSHRTSVTKLASRRNSQRGAELIPVTMGHPRQAMITPTMVSLA